MNTTFGPAIAEFELPLPVTLNASYGIGTSQTTGNARIVSTKEHREFKKGTALMLKNQLQLLSKDERAALTQVIEMVKKHGLFLYIEVLVFINELLSRDQDGSLKVVQDVVCECLGINDKYVLDAHIGKRKAYGNQRCEVRVFLCEGERA